MTLEDIAVDRSIVTGSVSPKPVVLPDPVRVSDETTIRNAVTSANIEAIAGGALSWANVETGSQGSIGQIIEMRDQGMLCRQFVASRESFDGVSLYAGRACLGPTKIWSMNSFDRVE
ncbi:RT0821/Lpp0805 family surface protein [Aquamicrobium sp. LC103]|uniref:RT0821/Lpp0805 family surface protein n=1 Tax=Aquamicrobium sp. LC103 TaxID=1120658 RepID=UPI001FEDFE8F|nr:RT0821/Lpp0805 family surface protein [Aquamicrobium sp. LC103]